MSDRRPPSRTCPAVSDRTPLFRRRATHCLQQRWFGPVRVLAPPSAWASALTAATVMAMLVATVCTVEIPDRIRTFGVLLPADGVLKVRASGPGRVEQLFVANGSSVERHDVLLRLSRLRQAPGREPELAERVASLRREIAMLEDTVEGETAILASRMNIDRRRRDLTLERVDAARGEYRARSREAELYRERADRVEQLAATRAVAAHTADEVTALALRATANSQAALQQLLSLQDELLAIEQQLLNHEAQSETSRRRAAVESEALAREIAASELQSALEITAPASGIVAGLTVRAGEDVRPGEILMTLHDPHSVLEARLYVSPDDAGMIVAGQRVELQLGAFPHELYGTQTAVVVSVSSIAVPAEELDPSLPFTGPVFEIRAALENDVIELHDEPWSLPPGTSFKADLVRHRWPLYRWLLRSVSGGASSA